MKKICFILIAFCCLSLSGQAQGIRFTEGNWKEVLEMAGREGKLVFVDCYTDWCQPCRKMEKQIFPSKKVGKFFNEHFINVKMDMERGEGPVLLNTYKINAFPTLLFVNAEGAEVYRVAGAKDEGGLLKVAAEALASKTVYPVDPAAQKQIGLIGKEIPDFGYRDSTGKEVRFSSFRGKYVYVDMWATWCRPCCEEIPYMSALEKKFHGKNICFVSISCDKDVEAWKKKLKNDKMEGIQLNCGGDPGLMKFFGIRGIPHFILLDPQGKVVNPNMSRPSQEITLEMLKRLDGI